MQTLDSIIDLLNLCSYPGYRFKIGTDPAPEGRRPYVWLQVICPNGVDTRTGAALAWKSRKWQLSYHMTDTEVVQTAWAAVIRALEHEAAELFTFAGRALFDRHLNVHLLTRLAADPKAIDGREEPGTSV